MAYICKKGAGRQAAADDIFGFPVKPAEMGMLVARCWMLERQPRMKDEG